MRTSTNLQDRGKGNSASWACGFMLVVSFLLLGTLQAQNWTKVGTDLTGNLLGDQFGEVVCLSADGNTMAVGIPAMGLNSTQEKEALKGSVEVYTWNGKSWRVKGEPITSQVANDGFGLALAMSADGNTLIIGAPYFDQEQVYDIGMAQVYEFNGQAWNAASAPFTGYKPEQMLGASVAINADGSVIAMSAPYGELGPESFGEVAVYKRVTLHEYISANVDGILNKAPRFTNQWKQVGNTLFGISNLDRFGAHIDLSSNGKVLAVGSPANQTTGYNAGMINVYVLRAGQWQKMGEPIFGILTGECAGRTFDLSDDGGTIAVGTPHYSGLYHHGGKVMVYYFNSMIWTVKGEVFFGNGAYDYFGYAVALNHDGSALAIGAPFINPVTIIGSEGQSNTLQQVIVPAYNLEMPKATAYVVAYKWMTSGGGITGTAKKSVGVTSVPEGHWAQLGEPILSRNFNDFFGNSVALAANQPVLLIGASQTKSAEIPSMGYAQAYTWADDQTYPQGVNANRYSIKGDVITTLPTPLMDMVYPNPTNGELTIQFVGYIEDFTLSIYHVSGNLVKQQQVTAADKVQVYIPGKPGVYYLEMLLATGEREMVRVVKQ